jgi:hypothetical protein
MPMVSLAIIVPLALVLVLGRPFLIMASIDRPGAV